MLSNSLKSSVQLKVRFNECDPLQIVWHGNYLKYFEDAREDFCLQNGISYLDMKKRAYATPIV
jgi:acyl-CoA thioester hydrolase